MKQPRLFVYGEHVFVPSADLEAVVPGFTRKKDEVARRCVVVESVSPDVFEIEVEVYGYEGKYIVPVEDVIRAADRYVEGDGVV